MSDEIKTPPDENLEKEAEKEPGVSAESEASSEPANSTEDSEGNTEEQLDAPEDAPAEDKSLEESENATQDQNSEGNTEEQLDASEENSAEGEADKGDEEDSEDIDESDPAIRLSSLKKRARDLELNLELFSKDVISDFPAQTKDNEKNFQDAAEKFMKYFAGYNGINSKTQMKTYLDNLELIAQNLRTDESSKGEGSESDESKE